MLSETEKDLIFRISRELLDARTSTQVWNCIHASLRKLLPYDRFACGFGKIQSTVIRPALILSEGFPAAYIEAIKSNGVVRADTLDDWLRTRKPLALNSDDNRSGTACAALLQAAREYRLSSLLCHGQMDFDRQHLSYAVFNRSDRSVDERDCLVIEHLMPQLHAALLRAGELSGASPQLLTVSPDWPSAQTASREMSLRQRQLLYLLGIGKTNREIAQILDTSVNNVKYHIKRLNGSFGTTCRVALTTTASRRGMLPSYWPESV